MNKFIAIGSALAVAAGVSLAAAVPASAQMGPWWNYHHGYHNYHRGYYGPGPAFGAGILGFVAGAAIAGAASDRDYAPDRGYASDGGHIAACQDAYRSYDLRTDTYLGYDGARHYCDL